MFHNCKRFCSLLLVVLMVFSMFCGTALAAEEPVEVTAETEVDGTAEPAAEETEEPVVEETEEPVVEETEEPVVEETEEPVVEETEEPVVEETEEPVVEETEEPVVEETEEPVVEETKEPVVEETKEPVVEETVEPVVEETEEPVVEETVEPVVEETEAPVDGEAEEPVVDSDDIIDSYDELVAALNSQDSVVVGGPIVIGGDEEMTLNLGGKTVSLGEYYIENQGTLTVTNGSLVADTYNGTTNGAPLWNNGGTLTIKAGTTLTGVCSALRVEGDGNVTIENGSFNATCTLGYTASIIRMKGGNLTIENGTFTGCNSVNSGEGCFIINATGGTAVIKNGVFSDFSSTPSALFTYNNWSETTNVTVNGGQFALGYTDGYSIAQVFRNYLAEDGRVSVNGDTYIRYNNTVLRVLPGSGTENDPYRIEDADDLATLSTNVSAGMTYDGQYIELTNSIELNGNWSPIGGAVRSSTVVGSGYAFQGNFNGKTNSITYGITNGNIGEDVCVGLFGALDGATISALTLNVTINVPNNDCAGGLAGMVIGNTTISNVTVNGSVKAAESSGGIVGRMLKEGHIISCVNEATVSGGGKIGGIAGGAYYMPTNTGMSIENCTNNGTITSTAGYVGGIAGLSAAKISGCENNANVTGANTGIGGIAGEQSHCGSVTGCSNSGNITNNASAYGTGGIVGWTRYNDSTNYTPSQVFITGNVNRGSVTGGNDAGGIVGTVYNSAKVTGNENYASTLSGTTFAGGIVANIQRDANNNLHDGTILVDNNISTTTSISGNCKNAIAYDNTQALDLANNSDAWQASVNGTKYATLAGAVKAAADGATVTLLKTAEGSGIIINKNLTIDFGYYTYTVGAPTVGSTGTETLGFQILAGSNATPYNVELKNGTIEVADVDTMKVGIMNYSNLTLTDLNLDCTGSSVMQCALATNNGTSVIQGSTSISVNEGVYAAIDVDGSQDYYGNASLTINTTGTITGNVEIYGEEAATKIQAGTFNGDISNEDGKSTLTISGGSFSEAIDSKYLEKGFELNKENTVVAIKVATIGETPYSSLQAAVDAAQDKDVILLQRDITFTKNNVGYTDGTWLDGIRYTGDKSFIIDLNGYTITDNGDLNDYLLLFNNKGEKNNEITLQNGTITGGNNLWNVICVSSSSRTYPTVLNLGDKLTINGTGANNAGEDGVVKVRYGSTVNMQNGSKITSSGTMYALQAVGSTSTVNVYNGAVIEQNFDSPYAIAVTGTGNANVYGGTITAVGKGYAVHTSTSGTPVFTISGGAINGNVVSSCDLNSYPSASALVKIEGGKINGSAFAIDYGTSEEENAGASMVITGGTFNADVSDYCAHGYVSVENDDNTFTVKMGKMDTPTVDNYSIDYISEIIVVDEGYELNSAADGSGASIADSIGNYLGKTIYIRTKSSNGYAPSDWFPIELTARPAKPVGVSVTARILGSEDGGTLIGVSTDMEYKLGNSDWLPGTGATISDLAPGKISVRYKATATTPCSEALVLTVNSKLATPVVTATTDSNGQPHLNWDAVEGAAKYQIWRYEGSSTGWKLYTTTTSTAFINITAEIENTYYYQVRAIASSDADVKNSAYTSVITVVCKCATPVVTANTNSSGKPVLTWNAVDGAVKYQIWRYEGSSTGWKLLTTTTRTSITNSSATAGKTYYYQVRAIASNNKASSARSATSTVVCKCTAPVVTAKTNSSNKPVLTWSAVDGAVKYQIWRYEGSSTGWRLYTTTTSTSFTNTSATAGKTYYYQVRAIASNTAANSAYTSVISVVCKCATPVVTAKTNSSGKPVLSWSAVEGATKYQIWRYEGSSTGWKLLTTTTLTSITNSSATAGKTYYYQVRAMASNTAANSAYTSVITVACK